MIKQQIWDLLKWLKSNHYLPQTESVLQEIVDNYSEQIGSKLIKSDNMETEDDASKKCCELLRKKYLTEGEIAIIGNDDNFVINRYKDEWSWFMQGWKEAKEKTYSKAQVINKMELAFNEGHKQAFPDGAFDDSIINRDEWIKSQII